MYSDKFPWPDADGNGYYLELIDPKLDNSIPENWTASNNYKLAIDEKMISGPKIYPNPVKDYLKIESDFEILNFSLSDINGRTLSSGIINGSSFILDMRDYPDGLYIIRIFTPAGNDLFKIVKL